MKKVSGAQEKGVGGTGGGCGTRLQQQTPRPKAEGRMETIPKVRIARVISTPAAGAFSAPTLITRVSIVQATAAFANPLALSRFIHLTFLQGLSP